MKQILLVLSLVILAITSQAQGIYNDGARIVSETGSYWVIGSGGFTLTSQSAATPATMANLTINSGASLTIGAGNFLTVSSTLTNNGTGGVVIESSSAGTGSLIVNAVAVSETGTTFARRWMPVANSSPTWHLASSSVTGQTVSGFLTANTNIPTSGSNRAMKEYNESINDWNDYYTTGTSDITPGKGYCMLTGSASAVTFTGKLNASTYNIATTKTGSYGWNCIGNPYSSAIKINTAADETNNFITVNSSKLDASYACIYVWDEMVNINQYSIINQASDATYATNGQAFFVKTAADANTVAFTPAMQIHHNTDVLFKSGQAPWPEIKLAALVNSKSVSTTIKFIDGTTKGLDVGYDAGIFKSDPSLALYTRLVESNGVDFALQCLPNSNFSGLIIPVGLDCKTGGEVIFSAETINLAADCKAILEDKLTSTFTDLSKGTYKAAVAANSVITDRFRLYAATPTISAVGDPLLEDQLKAFAVRNIEIRITGEVTPNAVASLYDTNGKLILTRKLDEGSLNVIPTPGCRSGMYVLKVNDKGTVKGFKMMMRE